MKDAEYYVRVFCDYAQAVTLNHELALQAPHILGILVDHAGELPVSGGYLHDVMSGRIDRMRKIHRHFSRSITLLRLLNEKQQSCVFKWEWYINKRPENALATLRTGKDVAEYLGVEYECFKKNRQRGLDRINAELGLFIA